MRNTSTVSGIGGCLIKHSLDMSEKDIQLVFDYLFHKQCMDDGETGVVEYRKQDFTMIPLFPENPDSLWRFECINGGHEPVTAEEFDPKETLRIAKKALFITNALRMRDITCSLNLKEAYF